jgi:hypothetical protein
MDALGNSVIGLAVNGLTEKEMPQAIEIPEAFCTQENVHIILQ